MLEVPHGQKLAWLERDRVAWAMSAVVAHEVIHAVAPATGEHASEGVMSRKLSEIMLLERELPLDERSAMAFRRELASLLAQSAEGKRASRTSVEQTVSAGPALREPLVEVSPQQ